MRLRRLVIIAALVELFSSVSIVCQPARETLPKDPTALLRLARDKNGLTGDDIKPWHIRGTYHRYKFGQLYYEGKYEEWWFSPWQYKLSFTSAKFTQTDYATRESLLRDGAQEWLSGPELLLHASLLEPLPGPTQLSDFKLHRATRTVRKSKVDCVTFRYKTRTGPLWEDDFVPSACVEASTPVIRVFSQGHQLEIQYDQIAVFQDRYIAHQIRVVSGTDKQLVADLDLDLVEGLEKPADTIVTPPASAVLVDLSRIVATNSGISFWPVPLIVAEPDLAPPPESRPDLNPPRTDSPSRRVVVKVSIGPDGHVTNATIVSGPPSSYQQSIEAAREWVFRPLTIMGQPRTVEMLLSFGR